MLACQEGDLQTVQNLIKAGADVNVTDCDGNTAIMLAVKEGDLEIVEYLFKAGGNVNTKKQ